MKFRRRERISFRTCNPRSERILALLKGFRRFFRRIEHVPKYLRADTLWPVAAYFHMWVGLRAMLIQIWCWTQTFTYFRFHFSLLSDAFLRVNKYQLSPTNPCNVLHHGKRAANKGGRSAWSTCDEAKLTTLATVDVFELWRVICRKSPF